MSKFKVGDTVEVTDQKPHAIGKIIAVSTWEEQLGVAHDSSPCYHVQCNAWVTPSWIDESHIKKVE